jgi:hypothetical protein
MLVVDTELLIVERTFGLTNQGGEITTLRLGPPDGYRLIKGPRTSNFTLWQKEAFIKSIFADLGAEGLERLGLAD